MEVIHFMRKPRQGQFSVERLFQDLRGALPPEIAVTVRECAFPSRGVVGRVRDILTAWRGQGDLNHVTGDVHYLTYFLRKDRTILTLLDCVALERLRGLRRWVFRFLWYQLPVRRCAAIVVISETTGRQVIEHTGCDPDLIHVIHCSVGPEFKPASSSFSSGETRVLHVGTNANKNLERHAAALAGLGCTLIVVGRLLPAQLSAIEANGLRYENHVDLSRGDLAAQYRNCDLLLFASTYEGFGLPIVEAQATGRPVVTSNCWSMPEVAGGAACLVDPLDVRSIRQGVRRILDDSRYRSMLVTKGFKNVQRFELGRIAGQHAALYQRVLAAAGKRSGIPQGSAGS